MSRFSSPHDPVLQVVAEQVRNIGGAAAILGERNRYLKVMDMPNTAGSSSKDAGVLQQLAGGPFVEVNSAQAAAHLKPRTATQM